MNKILVWHQGALGDLLLSFPAMDVLRRQEEETHIHLVSRTDLSDIILEAKLADEITSHDKGLFASLFVRFSGQPGPVTEFLKAFTSAYIFMRTEDEIFMENIRSCIPDCFVIRTVPPAGIRTHVSAFQLDQLRAVIGDKGRELPFIVPCSSHDIVSAPEAVIALHPGSGGKKKCWPLNNYLNLIELLNCWNSYQFKIILGPNEDNGVYERIASFFSGKDINAVTVRDKSVTEVASLLKTAALYVGNDSGISHLASHFGTSTIAIFGPTDDVIWKPVGRRVVVVGSQASCSPCQQEDYRKCSHADCMDSIRPDTVFDACVSLINAC